MDKIRSPPSRLDKLGVKPGTKVHLIGRHDHDFRRELAARGAVASAKKPDLVFLSVQEKDQLVELAYRMETPMWIIVQAQALVALGITPQNPEKIGQFGQVP